MARWFNLDLDSWLGCKVCDAGAVLEEKHVR